MTNYKPKQFIPYARPNVGEDDIQAVLEVLNSVFLTTGPYVNSFEQELVVTTSGQYATVCNSGTAALHLAYLALGLTAGDQVIVPAMTFCATANTAVLCGAEVIFADVDSKSGLITEETLVDAINRADEKKLKALCVVHLNGQLPDMAMIKNYADQYGLKVVEDACHALGSSYVVDGKEYKVGQCAHSDLCCFSFHPVKSIAMGEGGAITTNSKILADRMVRYRNHGLEMDPRKFTALPDDASSDSPVWHREMHMLGYNYRVSDILCALALSQLKKLGEIKVERQTLTKRYEDAFGDDASLISLLPKMPGQAPCWHLFPVFVDFQNVGVSREDVMAKLSKAGIGSQVHYWPVTHHPYWQQLGVSGTFDGANDYYKKELSLPLFSGLSVNDQNYVIDAMLSIIQGG